MKTLKYILSFVIFISLGNVLYGQVSISTVSPNPACIGDIVTIVGNGMKPTYLKLKQAGGSDIDLSGDIQAGATATQIEVLLSSSTIGAVSGTVEFEVEKNTGVAGASKATESFVLNPTPQVTLSVQGGSTVCSGGSATLNFTVSNSDGGSVLINYTKGGTPATTTATGDGIHSVVVSPITTPTIYTLVSAKLTTCTNVTTITGQSKTITITPTPTVALAIQGGNNTICPGQNAILNFTVGNSGGANVTINYTVNGAAAATVASGDGTHSVTVSPTVQTDYVVTSATIGTCTTPITNQDETINIDDVADVTLSVQGGTNTICSGESATLNFTVSNSGGGNVTIHYSKNGVVTTTTANGNGVHSVSITPTTTTLYTIISTTTATGCAKTINNQSQTITVQPNITGTLTASANAICNGESVNLFFTANNPNGDNLIFHYKKGTTNLTATTTGTFVSVSSGALSAETTFTLVSIENTTTNCTKNITTNNTVTIEVNNTMGVLMTSSVSSLCFGGSYDLSFTITGSKANDDITILYSQDGVTIPLNVTINATNTNTLVTVNFTANQTRSHSLVSITNNTTGCFTNYSPSAINTIQINVTPSLSASISTSADTICNGSNTNVIFSVDNPNSELITIRYTDGVSQLSTTTTSSSKIITVTPSITTTYTLQSVETSACTYSFTSNNTLTVTVNKVPSATLSGGGVSCNGSQVLLNFEVTNKNSINDLITFQYLDNNGLATTTTTSTTSTVSVVPSATTVYSLVSVMNNTVGCTNFISSQTATVLVGNSLTAEIQASTNEICIGESVTFNFIINNAVGVTRLYYTKDGGTTTDSIDATNSSASLTVTPTTPSAGITYELTGLKAISTGCTGSLIGTFSETIIVNGLPNIALSGDATICRGDATQLQVNITGGTPPFNINYRAIEGGAISDQNYSTLLATSTQTVQPTQNARYKINNLTDGKGCQDVLLTDTVFVTVNPLPTTTITVDDNILCKGDNAVLTFTVGNNNNHEVVIYYNRTINNITTSDSISTTSAITLPITPLETTTYVITGSRNRITGCYGTPGAVNNSVVVTVNPLPTVQLAVPLNLQTVCDGSSTRIDFTFPIGLAPFTIIYEDSLSNSTTRNTPSTPWTNLVSGVGVNEQEFNVANNTITHTYFVSKITDNNGCITNYSIGNQPNITVNIDPTPVVTLTGVQPLTQPYASTDLTAYGLQGTPIGGNFSGPGTGITLYPSGQNYSTVNFIPANSGFLPTDTLRDIVLNYTYTESSTGCTGVITDTARISKALNFLFYNENSDTLQTTYCRNADSTYIYAKVDGIEPLGLNTFELDAISSTVFSNVQSFGDSVRVTFTPLNATGTFSLKFGSTASGFITRQVTIIDTINTIFSPFINGVQFCQSTKDSIFLIGIPSLDVQNANGVFSSPTLGIIAQNNSQTIQRGWHLKRQIPGFHKVIYTYTDVSTGCITQAAQTVQITPKPVANYLANIECNDKKVTFINNSGFTQSAIGIDSLVHWNWIYGDGSVTDTALGTNQIHTYTVPGAFTATLNVTSALGCTDNYDTTITVGTIPIADLDWKYATIGDNTLFSNESSLPTLAAQSINVIDSLSWDFGDGTPVIKDAISNVSNPTHGYPNLGIYQATVTAFTNNGCENSKSMQVYILPRVTTYPYYERFDNSDGNWIRDSVTGVFNEWEWSNLNKKNIKDNNLQNKAWVTRADTFRYATGRDIWVYSPTFDFSTIQKPMLAFRYWCDTRNSDGAVIQYSTDSAETWNVLGALETGLEWYDFDNLVAQPGNQSGFDGFGWSAENTGWQVARHKLDELQGQSAVRFRIAFASSAGANNNYDGFAFDDFWVGERQKKVLVEYFTNTNAPSYIQKHNDIYQLLQAGNNDLDIVMVEYHNNLPGNDNFNLFNPADPSGRALFYQFSETGKTIIDGTTQGDTIASANWNLNQPNLDLFMLQEPVFNISIDNFTKNANDLSVTATFKARKPQSGTSVASPRKVYIAIVEDGLNANGTPHRSVLRKLLPSAAGVSLTNAWAIGTQQTVTQTWAFNPSEVNPANLKVVVWIQNSETKEVYQTAFSDFPNTLFDSTVVNTKTSLENTENMVFNLFPNPNNGNFTITFSSPMTTKTNWQLINISGQIIHQGQIATHQENVNITTNDLPKGMYFFRMYNEKGISEVRKVLVE